MKNPNANTAVHMKIFKITAARQSIQFVLTKCLIVIFVATELFF